MTAVYARRICLVLGLLASALSAGFFYTYSISVMPGLAAADPLSAIRAMQGINSVIRTAVFAFAFFGALVLPVGFGVAAWFTDRRNAAALAFGGAAIYAGGVFAVTFLVNVPLNDGLARVQATTSDAAEIWAAYAEPWTAWNHVRAVTAAAAFACMSAASVVSASPRRFVG